MISTSALIEKFNYALQNDWGYIWGTAGETWTKTKQNNLVQYFVNKYGSDWKNDEKAKKNDRYRGALSGSKWIGHTVADCSGLFSWAFKLLGGYMYHGSNTIWKEYCTSRGELTKNGRTDGGVLKPGTAVFTGTESNKGHIGLYVGNDKVIEASGTIAGVITTTISGGKWKYWGELKDVDYGDDTVIIIPPAIEPFMPTLKRGNKGNYVKELQTMLSRHGYDLGKYGIDGDFGSATEAAVKSFQTDHNLKVDGIVGKNTWAALKEDPIPQKKFKATIVHLTKDEVNELVKKFQNNIYFEEED